MGHFANYWTRREEQEDTSVMEELLSKQGVQHIKHIVEYNFPDCKSKIFLPLSAYEQPNVKSSRKMTVYMTCFMRMLQLIRHASITLGLDYKLH